MIGATAVVGLTSAGAATHHHAVTKTTLAEYNGKWGHELVVEMKGQKLALYNFSKDNGKSSCYGSCQKAWYPLLVHGKIVAAKGSGIKTKQLKTTKRTNGSLQVTYYGQPLYRYHKDTKTGQRGGANKYQFGGSWGLMGVNGSPLTSGVY